MKAEPLCKNCALYNRRKGECKVMVFHEGKQFHMPVFPEDRCHLLELGIPAQQIRWWVEDPATGQPAVRGVVKVEYPEKLFEKGR